MSDGTNSGKKFEKLVAMLERVLAGSGASIESPCRRLIDRDTGKSREHDIVITWNHNHHVLISAIECRDRSRPVGVPDVEAFADKCAATGVSRGVIVSASGFRATARSKAKTRAIICMDLAEVENFDWFGTRAFIHFNRVFEPVHAQLIFSGSVPSEVSAIFDTDGNEVDDDRLTATVINNVPPRENPDDDVGFVIPVKIRMNTINWHVRDEKGDMWTIDHIIAETKFATVKSFLDFDRYTYSGEGKEYSVVSTKRELDGVNGKMVLIKDNDGLISLGLGAPYPRKI